MKSDKTLWIGVVIVIVAFVGFIVYRRLQPGAYDTLAQCLTDKGVKEYGAYWCPNCQRQKKDFGNSFKKLTYIECSIPGNQQSQTVECNDMSIAGYPTWIFPNDERLVGYQPLSALAEKSGCPLQPAT